MVARRAQRPGPDGLGYLEGRYLDAVWFPEAQATGQEEPGASAPERFPIEGEPVVLCESKLELGPELIGQALVYRQLALRAGALVQEVYAFAESGYAPMLEIAAELGLIPIVLNPLHAARG